MRDRIDFARHIDNAGIHPAPARQRLFHHDRGVAHVADLADRFTLRQAMRHLHQRTLAVAEDQHVGFRIHQHRTAHGIRPVVVVCGAAQARLDAAQDHRHVFPCFFASLGVDEGRAIGTFTRHVVSRVSVVMAQLTVGGIAVDHRVHVARGHAEEQVRLAQTHKVVFAVPVRLGDDPHAEALGFKHTATDRHAKARVIDIRIARHQNDIAAVPAQLIHLFPGHRQERRRSKAGCPVLGPGEEVAIRLDQGNSAHNASEEKIDKRSGIIRWFTGGNEGVLCGLLPSPQPSPTGRGRKCFTVPDSPASALPIPCPSSPASGCGTGTGSAARKADRSRRAVRPGHPPRRYLSSPCLPGTASPR